MLKVCLDCGAIASRRRCDQCQRQRDRARAPRPTTLIRTAAEKRRRAAVVRAWVNRHGWICPGYECDPHASKDLTADHIVAAAHGGTALAVLCRRCNGRKSDRL